MTSSYEKQIRQHDPQFYEAILSYVDLMPDFRPQETLRRMKSEPPNNWRRISDELTAISFHPSDEMVLSVINSEEEKELVRIIDDHELISTFIFSYPALTWLLMKIGKQRMVVPLIISQRETIFDLHEIPMKRSYIRFINDMETAIKLRNIYYRIAKDDWVFSRIDSPVLNLNSGLYEKGYFYWLLAGNSLDPLNLNYKIYERLANTRDISLFEHIEHIISLLNKVEPKREENYLSLLDAIVRYGFTEAVDILVNRFKFTDSFLLSQIITATNKGFLGITYILLQSLSSDISEYHTESVFEKSAIKRYDIGFARLFLSHPHTKENLMTLPPHFYSHLIQTGSESATQVLSELLSTTERTILGGDNDSIIKEAIKDGSKECIDLILDYFSYSLSIKHIELTLEYNNLYAFEKLVTNDKYADLLSDVDNLLFDAIRGRKTDFLLLLIKHPRIEEIVNLGLLREARMLVKTYHNF